MASIQRFPILVIGFLTMALSCKADEGTDIRQLVATGLSERRNGELASAESHLVKALDLALLTSDASIQALAYHELASLRHDQLKSDEAISLYEKGLEKTVIAFGESSLAYAVAKHNFGQLLSDVGQYEKARPHLEKAISIARVEVGAETALFNFLNTLGILCRREGKLRESVKHYDEVLGAIEKKQINDPILTASLCLNLGFVFADSDEPKSAEIAFNKSINFMEQLQATSTVPAAATYNALARLKLKLGDTIQAKQFAAKALEICLAKLGSDHPHTATALESTGDVLLAEGKWQEAAEQYAKVLVIREKKFGKEHQLVAELLARRAKVELALEQPELAATTLALAYKILTKRFGDVLPPSYRWIANEHAGRLRAKGLEVEAQKVSTNVRPTERIK